VLRALLRANGEGASAIRPEHFGAGPVDPDPVDPVEDLEARTRHFRRLHVERVVARSASKSDAARRLGISRDTLYRLLRGDPPESNGP
jgi:transcriptional regulator with PAS, ATPase and Fis domain